MHCFNVQCLERSWGNSRRCIYPACDMAMVYALLPPTPGIANSTGFYINLPLGAITAVILVFFFSPHERTTTKQSLTHKIKHLDLPGLALFIPAVVMVLLAVQWGGTTHAWKSATIIGLFVGFGVLICLFAAWQWFLKDEASIPPRIMCQRSVYSAAVVVFMGMGSVQLIAYYLPMWFQVIKNDTPLESGIRFLFSVLGGLLGSIIPGGLGKNCHLSMRYGG